MTITIDITTIYLDMYLPRYLPTFYIMYCISDLGRYLPMWIPTGMDKYPSR